MDVINAENSAALKIANSALNGKISTFVDQKRQELLDIIATISVNIDYPEYDDVEQLTNEDILPKLKTIKLELEDVLNNAKSAKLLKNGINTVIVGKPNVGKSSFINCLVNRKNIARISSRPGKTQTLNFYLVNGSFYLVDVPGYGYAAVDRRTQEKFGKMIEEYLVMKGLITREQILSEQITKGEEKK